MVCDKEQVVVGLLNKSIEVPAIEPPQPSSDRIQVYDRSSLKLARVLWGHNDHVWSIDMNREFIVRNSTFDHYSVCSYFWNNERLPSNGIFSFIKLDCKSKKKH